MKIRTGLLYPKNLNPWDLEPEYHTHVAGMTEEELHAKADIAIQLAWRDRQIKDLKKLLLYAGVPVP